LFLTGQSRPYRKGTGSQRSPILRVPFYLCVTLCHRTIKFDVVTHVGEGSVFRSATTLHLHKCVARFVSGSCFLVSNSRFQHIRSFKPFCSSFDDGIALSLVSSRLDYVNSVFSGCPRHWNIQLDFQQTQNALAGVVATCTPECTT